MKQLSLKRKNLKKNIQLNDCITVLRRLIEGLSVSEGPYFIAIKNSSYLTAVRVSKKPPFVKIGFLTKMLYV